MQRYIQLLPVVSLHVVCMVVGMKARCLQWNRKYMTGQFRNLQ